MLGAVSGEYCDPVGHTAAHCAAYVAHGSESNVGGAQVWGAS